MFPPYPNNTIFKCYQKINDFIAIFNFTWVILFFTINNKLNPFEMSFKESNYKEVNLPTKEENITSSANYDKHILSAGIKFKQNIINILWLTQEFSFSF